MSPGRAAVVTSTDKSMPAAPADSGACGDSDADAPQLSRMLDVHLEAEVACEPPIRISLASQTLCSHSGELGNAQLFACGRSSKPWVRFRSAPARRDAPGLVACQVVRRRSVGFSTDFACCTAKDPRFGHRADSEMALSVLNQGPSAATGTSRAEHAPGSCPVASSQFRTGRRAIESFTS